MSDDKSTDWSVTHSECLKDAQVSHGRGDGSRPLVEGRRTQEVPRGPVTPVPRPRHERSGTHLPRSSRRGASGSHQRWVFTGLPERLLFYELVPAGTVPAGGLLFSHTLPTTLCRPAPFLVEFVVYTVLVSGLARPSDPGRLSRTR